MGLFSTAFLSGSMQFPALVAGGDIYNAIEIGDLHLAVRGVLAELSKISPRMDSAILEGLAQKGARLEALCQGRRIKPKSVERAVAGLYKQIKSASPLSLKKAVANVNRNGLSNYASPEIVRDQVAEALEKAKSLKMRIAPFGITIERYGIWEHVEPSSFVIEPKKDTSIPRLVGYGNGFGCAIIQNGAGLILGEGYYFCSRVTIFDPETKIAVDSHFPVDYGDMEVFEYDMSRLLKRLQEMGVRLENMLINLVYGTLDTREGEDPRGVEMERIMKKLGLNVNQMISAEDDGEYFLFDLGTGDVIRGK